jgi:hypothetical protein
MHRGKMEEALIKDVENWELCDLIEWTKNSYALYLRDLSDKQMENEFEIYLALSDEELEAYLEE